MTAQIGEINSLLGQVRRIIIEKEGDYYFSDREKNKETLLKLGFMPRHVKDIICELTYHNYSSGPERNKGDGRNDGTIWIFGKTIDSIEIYIKICIVLTKKNTCCVCLSFHESEYTMSYPYATHQLTKLPNSND